MCVLLVVASVSAKCHVPRRKGRKGRGQDSDEAYTDDEDISESDSDNERMPSVSAQEASADDLSTGDVLTTGLQVKATV